MLAKKKAEEEAELTFKPKKIANFKKVKAQVDNKGQEITHDERQGRLKFNGKIAM